MKELIAAVGLVTSVTSAFASACPPTSAFSVCQVTGDTVTIGNSFTFVTYAWYDTNPVANSATIGFACVTSGFAFTIKDEIGTAGQYPITVTPNGTDSIDHNSSFVINSNFESITFQCDGAGNWIVE